MLSLIARVLLFVAAAITSWLVARDANDFIFIKMTVAVLLWVLLVFALAFWPSSWVTKLKRRKKLR